MADGEETVRGRQTGGRTKGPRTRDSPTATPLTALASHARTIVFLFVTDSSEMNRCVPRNAEGGSQVCHLPVPTHTLCTQTARLSYVQGAPAARAASWVMPPNGLWRVPPYGGVRGVCVRPETHSPPAL